MSQLQAKPEMAEDSENGEISREHSKLKGSIEYLDTRLHVLAERLKPVRRGQEPSVTAKEEEAPSSPLGQSLRADRNAVSAISYLVNELLEELALP